jgi:hypothetical protein
MRYVILGCLIALALGLITFGLAATPSDPLASFDPHRPAALLLNIDGQLRAFRAAASELVRDLINEVTAMYDEQIHHEKPGQSLPR